MFKILIGFGAGAFAMFAVLRKNNAIKDEELYAMKQRLKSAADDATNG